MSVSSILAFVLAGVAAKKARADRPAAKSPTYAELVFDNADLRRRLEELEDDVARANVQYRRDQELIDLWRARALTPPGGWAAQVPAGPDFRPIALQQQHAAQLQQFAHQTNQGLLAQMNAQQAQQAAQMLGMQKNRLAQGLLGSQQLDPGLWCNCVPSRSQVWAADRTD